MVVPRARIENNGRVFHCMIGLVRGRVYYNLLNWYRVLAMLPGFTVNRRFMEQMMGVKEGLPDELVCELETASPTDRLKDSLRLGVTVAGLVWNHFTLSARIREFYARLNRALRPLTPPLDQMRPDELAAHYQDLERQLLTRWDAPLVNDFFAMIFYGTLRKLVAKWCADTDGTLQNNLLCGQGGIISAEPARRVRELAAIAARHPDLAEKLASAPSGELAAEADRVPEFAGRYREYLERFGDRCLDELKLESPTLHDDPVPLLRSVGHLAAQARKAGEAVREDGAPSLSPREERAWRKPARGVVQRESSTDQSSSPRSSPRPSSEERGTKHQPPGGIEMQLRREAEARTAAALRGHPLRSLVFRWVLKHARARVRERENLRFERTRLFGRVRRILVALGREFQARGLITAPDDIFYLELAEVLGFCDGTTTTTDLKALVALRRAEFARHAQSEAPADRFETRGPVFHGNTFQASLSPHAADAAAGDLQGIGCCPGVVRGPVRVVTSPQNAVLKPGEILVAERTDPGWIMLFASAAGLLVERGSLLSHSAIVSREMGIPAIVSITGLTRYLKDGDWVELNGSTGQVKRIQHD
jgi:pyruvate,water dikinase